MTQGRSENTGRLFAELRALPLTIGQYAIFGSGPLGIRGLRDIHDIDVIAAPELFDSLAKTNSRVNHDHGLHKIQIGDVEILDGWYPDVGPVGALIADAEMIEGLPFVQLEKVLEWKLKCLREKSREQVREKDTLDVARIAEYLVASSTTTALRMEQFLPRLRRQLFEAPGETLYVSIGEGDLTASWLSRLYEDVPGPQLGGVVVLRVREDTITALEMRGDLVRGFGKRVRQNLETLEDLLGGRGITLAVRESERLPPFHGYLYGDHFFRGEWWKGEPHYHVRTTVKHLQRATAAQAFNEAIAVFTKAPVSPQLTVGIVVPLEEEWNELIEVFKVQGRARADGTFYYTLDSGRPDVHMVGTFIEQMGPLSAAITATQLIERYRPDLIVVIGIAGSLDRDVALGDVVVASVVNQYQATSKAEQDGKEFRMSYSGETFRADRSLIKAVIHASQYDEYKQWQSAAGGDQDELKVPQKTTPRDHIGRVASGDTVGSATAFVQEVRKIDRKFLALEMEAAGVAAAAAEREQPVKWLAIRGISDRSDETKAKLDAGGTDTSDKPDPGTDENRGVWRKYAMRSAARYLAALLRWDEFRKKARRS